MGYQNSLRDVAEQIGREEIRRKCVHIGLKQFLIRWDIFMSMILTTMSD